MALPPRLVKRCAVVFLLVHIASGGVVDLLRRSPGAAAAVLLSLVWLAFDASRCNAVLLELQAARAELERALKRSETVVSTLCDYDPTACEALYRFRPVTSQSKCLFAKAAKLWGSRNFDLKMSLEENVRRSVPTLVRMLEHSESEGIDGFVFEVRSGTSASQQHGSSVEKFAACVNTVLGTISDMDPRGRGSARKSYIGDRAWHFVFAGHPIFITTFAPCYSPSSSRTQYEADSSSCFILLQPESSFLRHDLPHDTPHTSWDQPKTIRDRIRISFERAGQSYFIPPSVSYPASEHIVKPLVDDGKAVVRWWEY